MKAIPYGVFKRLAKLTSKTKGNLKKKINILYPQHIKALSDAKLTPKKFPTMEDILNDDNKSKGNKNKKRTRKREFSRQTFFCAGVSDVFRNKYAIHVLIKQLRQKHNLK